MTDDARARIRAEVDRLKRRDLVELRAELLKIADEIEAKEPDEWAKGLLQDIDRLIFQLFVFCTGGK